MRTRDAFALLALLSALAAPALAGGLVIPDEPDQPPLALVAHKVSAAIEAQAALTSIEQTFANNTERRLEASYVFPLPRGAGLERMAVVVDGREQKGEVLESGKARRLYQELIARAAEPALLDDLGRDLFRARVLVEPRGRVTLRLAYRQALEASGGLVRYLYPVRPSGKRGATVHGEASVEVEIKSHAPLANVDSPSPPVSVTRSGDRQARAVWSAKDAVLERHFELFWGTSGADLGLHLVAHRPDPAAPGWFMLLISPKSDLASRKLVERDLVFVIDTSGSMEGAKIRQARAALRHCVEQVGDRDRFNVVRFSTDVYPWRDSLVSGVHRKAALPWIDELTAQGGTDIAGALQTALSYPRDRERPYYVIFITDGKPTLGETVGSPEILARARADARGARIFTWGVGHDVDTHLLDGIAESTAAVSEYVHPEEDLAAKLTAFYSRISYPVLTGLKLEVVGEQVRLTESFPRAIPDLYARSQLVLIGRYTGSGDVALRLSGEVNGKPERFTYEARFPASFAAHRFIEPLWARRRIGHLLDQIRLHGSNPELVSEVVALSRRHGIQTPYTSFLVAPDGRLTMAGSPSPHARQALGLRAEAFRSLDGMADRAGRAGGALPPAQAAEREEARKQHNDEAKAMAEGFDKKDGKSAVEAATYLRRLKEASGKDAREIAAVRTAGGVRFLAYRGMWVDERFDERHATLVVRFASRAYFDLLERHPRLVEAAKLGDFVVIVWAPGKALIISPESGITEPLRIEWR